MTIDVLLSGKLFKEPEQRPSSKGTFVRAKMKAHDGEGDVWVSLVAFSKTAQAALMALGDGDALSVAGSAKITAYTDRDGKAKSGMDVIVHSVLTAYHVQRKREAMQAEKKQYQGNVYGYSEQEDRADKVQSTPAKNDFNPNDDLDIPF